MAIPAAPMPSGHTRSCPKCGFDLAVSVTECPRCHVIIDKAEKAMRTRTAAAEPGERSAHGWAGRLAAADQLYVEQTVERLEAWTGFESANTYAIKDGLGNTVFHAAEEKGSMKNALVRQFLKAQRPFTMRIEALHGETALVLDRPFRFFFSEIAIQDAMGRTLGSVKRRFAFFNSVYEVHGPNPTETYEIFGPMFRPWTFKIRRGGQPCGLISKKWGGLGREMLTDADKFGIEFPPGISPEMKAVLLGAVFLIDFAHFEDNND